MFDYEREAYAAHFNVRRVNYCCGNCRYFKRQCDSCGCTNQRQADWDEMEREARKREDCIPEEYGPYGQGIFIDEGFICNLWEEKR